MEFALLNWDLTHGKIPNPSGIFPSRPQLCKDWGFLGGELWEGGPGGVPSPFPWDCPVWVWNFDPRDWDRSGSGPVDAQPLFWAVFLHQPKFGKLLSIPLAPIPAPTP